ncbi:MAG: HD domain-containing phosphohydrolase [Deltaproteobacteria bacterium]
MSIRVKFLIACLCCALIPLIGYAGYTYARTVQHLGRLENGQLAAREMAVSQALDDAVTRELADVDDTVTWPAFVRAVEREDVPWLRRQLAALPAVAVGGTAQLFTPGGQLMVAAGPPGAGSLWTGPEVQHVVGLGAPAAGYETLAGRLSIVAAERVEGGSGPQQPLAVLAVARPLDRVLLDTIRSYAGVQVTPASQDATDAFIATATPPPAGNGVLNQFGDTFTRGEYRSAYLGVYDVDGYRSGLVRVSMERRAVTAAVGEIRTVAVAALMVALAAAIIAALLVSRRISRPLHELAAAAVGIADGETRQEIHVHGNDEVGQLAGAFNRMAERVTERVTHLSETISSITEEFADLNVTFGETVADAVDVEEQLPRMVHGVGDALKADAACLYLPDARGLRAVCGEAGPDAGGLEEAARQAADAGSAVAAREDGGAGYAAAPLKRADRGAGALAVGARTRGFDAQDVALLSALTGQLAMVIQHAEMLEHLEASYLSTVTALASAVEAKDGYPADHCRLIAEMAEIVGRRLGLGDADLRLLRYAAILHDIGKTGVAGSVLRSPAPLTAEQSALIADHTVAGESVVARIQYLSPIAPIIRSAHERWDGGGYPDRLRGEEIRLSARIVFVCDAFHAMVSDRPYRRALGHEAAFAELLDQAGAQFDPRVVQAFVASRDAIERLLLQGPRAARSAERVLATVLVTDIVDSTGKAAAMGDTAFRDLLERHHATVRELLRRYRGTEVDTAGDGFLATFDGAARAVECAAAVGRELAPLGLEIRAGCHTGEIEVTGAGVRGIAVHIGARVAAVAEPGEILVSSIVKDLVAGSGLVFVDRGAHELKGVPGVWRLYAVQLDGARRPTAP